MEIGKPYLSKRFCALTFFCASPIFIGKCNFKLKKSVNNSPDNTLKLPLLLLYYSLNNKNFFIIHILLKTSYSTRFIIHRIISLREWKLITDELLPKYNYKFLKFQIGCLFIRFISESNQSVCIIFHKLM